MSFCIDVSSVPARPEVVSAGSVTCVAIPVRATLADWGDVNAEIGRLGRWMGQHGLSPAGPPMYRYVVMGGEDGVWEVEVGFPISAIDGERLEGEVDPPAVVRVVEPGRHARWLHRGHPDRLAGVHSGLQDWIRGQGEEPAREVVGGSERWGGVFDVFLTDPAVEPDPARWDTLVVYRLS